MCTTSENPPPPAERGYCETGSALEDVMNSILGAIVRNMQVRRRYLSGIPDRGWGFVAPYVAPPVGATEHGISPEVAEHSEAGRGFVLLRLRAVVECLRRSAGLHGARHRRRSTQGWESFHLLGSELPLFTQLPRRGLRGNLYARSCITFCSSWSFPCLGGSCAPRAITISCGVA